MKPLRQRRSALALMLIAAILALIVVIGYRFTLGYWDRLRSAVEAFGAPTGLLAVSEVEQGTTFCIITCGKTEAAIVVQFQGYQIGIEEMCDLVGARARKVFRSVVVAEPYAGLPQGLIGCVYAEMPEVGRGAYLQATGSCFRRDNCISVTFSSGIE